MSQSFLSEAFVGLDHWKEHALDKQNLFMNQMGKSLLKQLTFFLLHIPSRSELLNNFLLQILNTEFYSSL